MVAFLVVVGAVLTAGVADGRYPGLYIAFVGFTLGNLMQLGWVWYRARPGITARDKADQA